MNTLLAAGAINWHSFFFLLFALMACAFGVAVLVSSNIVRMAFYLTISLGATAGLFFLAGAHFVGAMQIMIYVGGTLVLLIFGVMLTAKAPFISMKTPSGEWILAAIVGSSLLAVLVISATSVSSWRAPNRDAAQIPPGAEYTTTPLAGGLVGLRVDKANAELEIERQQAAMEADKGQLTASAKADRGARVASRRRRLEGMSGYLLPFEIVSVHLLVVLIGSAYLARAKRRVEGVAAPRAAEAGEPKERSTIATVLLWALIFLGLVESGLCFFTADSVRKFTAEQSLLPGWILPDLSQPDWLVPALGAVALLTVLFLAAVLAWQKWAFYAAVSMVVLLAILLLAAEVGFMPTLVLAVVAAVPLALLYYALQAGDPKSTWSQME